MERAKSSYGHSIVKIVSFIMTIVMVVTCLPVSASESADSISGALAQVVQAKTLKGDGDVTSGSAVTTQSAVATESAVATDDAINGSDDTDTSVDTGSDTSVASKKTGFVKTSTGKYYYKNGTKLKSRWIVVNGREYYLNKTGLVVTGPAKVGGIRYYFNSNGVLQKSRWANYNGYRYYVGKRGQLAIGRKRIKGSVYYFDVKGRMQTGWVKIKSSEYYFGKKGVMATGKKKIDKSMCYFGSKGVLKRRIYLNKKMVALTYDDGPSIYTPQILKVLKANDSVATFFEVGNRVSTYASTVKKLYNMGCEIGNHTYEHKILTGCSVAEIRRQIRLTNKAVKAVTGAKTIITRPPGGSHSAKIDSIINTPVILWSIDTEDWRTRNAQSTINSVLNNVNDGDVVLMHDLYSATAQASKTIIPALVKRGYQLVTVSELADCRGGIKNGVTYSSFKK